LAAGDRVLVRLESASPGPSQRAIQIVAVKQSDVELKQQKEREDWQRRGVGGLVKSVDAASGTIVLSSGFGATAKTITVHTGKATMLKRYAPASVRFNEALPAPIDSIHPGDQLRARGQKNADGTEVEAEEVVSGAFRNISGTIASLDTAGSTLVVKDLASKKAVSIHITTETQMRRLPERMAQMLAARLKGTTISGSVGSAGGGAGAVSVAGNGGAAGATRGAGQWSGQGSGQGPGQAGGQGAGGGPSSGQNGGAGGGDPQQMLSRLPPVQLSDLQKAEAVMVVSTEGTNEVTAITLLAGVEPLLEAPAASQNLLNNWSLGSGEPEAAVQ
jgi:hypothetical protein